MFFQPVPPVDDSTSKGNQGKALEVDLTKTKVEDLTTVFKDAQDALSQFSSNILQTFTQGRERIFELQKALVDALPNVTRLGGNLSDVQKIISGVAEASRRNVVASTEQIEKLYTLEKLVGKTGGELAETFLNVGVGIESIPEALGESIQYVQSIGGNAKTVFADVYKNMDQMNRFQFEDGVLGLTKMAAQASMMRVDVGQTLKFADDVLDPDRAIEVAGAFQRLGVAAGTLVDPFALMNASINDPSGLQDSLIEVSKQFTYFDDETKSFKINRQGVLTLREMEKAAGLTQGTMSKMALAASELDERLSQISPSIKFENEEDKQYLANIGSMTKGGQYEVKFRDEKGIEQMRKLSEITQDEFNLLIKQQKDSNKPIEETAREQLTNQQTINQNLAAVRSIMMGATLTSDASMDITEGLRQGYDAFLRAGGQQMNVEEFRKTANENAEVLKKDLIESINKGETSPEQILVKLTEGAVNIFGSVSKKSMETLGEASGKIAEELKKEENTETAKALSTAVTPILQSISTILTGQNYIPSPYDPTVDPSMFSPMSAPATSVTVGGISPSPSSPYTSSSLPSRDPIKVEFGPVPDINLNFNNGPQNMTPQQIEEITKIFERLIQRQDIKNYLVNNTNESRAYQSGTPLGI
jgi:hypothetical protein